MAAAPLAGVPLTDFPWTLIDYLSEVMAGLPHEQMRIFFLDGAGRLLSEKIVCDGKADMASLHVPMLIGTARRLRSPRFILAHNHPAGDPAPSEADIGATRHLSRLIEPSGLVLHEHFVVASGGWCAMLNRTNGR